MKEARQTLCAFLNGGGGTGLFGVGPNGGIEGQYVSGRTLRNVVQAGQRFEPPADLTVQRLPVTPGCEVLAVTVPICPDAGPFVYDDRPVHGTPAVGDTDPHRRVARHTLPPGAALP